MVDQLEQLPVISNYAGKPLSFTSLLPMISVEDSPSLRKYWSQRYRLFSRYDQGIQMDKGERERERWRRGESQPHFSAYNFKDSQVGKKENLHVCAQYGCTVDDSDTLWSFLL